MNRLYVVATLVSAVLVGCASGPGEGGENGESEAAPSPSESTELAPLAEAGRYCVDQSYATATKSSADACPSSLGGSQLSEGHPVHIFATCSAWPPYAYVHVVSLWNGIEYYMRRDALSPC